MVAQRALYYCCCACASAAVHHVRRVAVGRELVAQTRRLPAARTLAGDLMMKTLRADQTRLLLLRCRHRLACSAASAESDGIRWVLAQSGQTLVPVQDWCWLRCHQEEAGLGWDWRKAAVRLCTMTSKATLREARWSKFGVNVWECGQGVNRCCKIRR
jgi:hypothetical protein